MEEKLTEISTRCKNPRGYLVNRKQRLFLRCGCGRWVCEGCGKYKTRCVARRFALLGPTHFITQTVTIDSERHMKARMRALARWYQRQPWGISVWGWVREFGAKKGRVHLHMLVRFKNRHWQPWYKIQAAARRNKLGNVDIKPILSQAYCISYVIKYLTKDIRNQKLHGERNGRRFALSPGYALTTNAEWCYSKQWPQPSSLAGVFLRLVIPDERGGWISAYPVDSENTS